MNNNMKQSLKKYMRPYFLYLALTVVLATLGSIATIIGPDQLSEITNLIVSGLFTSIDMTAINNKIIFMIFLYCSSAILTYSQSFIITGVVQKFIKTLRSQISEKINKVPLSYFDSHTQGDTLSRVTNDLDTLSQTLNQSLSTFVPALTLLIGTLFMMFKSNVILSLSSLLSVALGFVAIIFIMGKARPFLKSQQEKLAILNGHIEESYSGHSILLVSNALDQATNKFEQQNQDLYNSSWKAQFLSGLLQPLMGFIGNLGYVVVCVVGALLALDGQIEFGTIVAFIVYVRLLSQPLGQLSQGFANLQQASAAMFRVFEFLDAKEMEDETNKVQQLENIKGHVTFSNVQFGYDENKPIIHNFSAQAKPGQKIAIVGPTGAGKTTIVNLLMKFYNIQKGSITIDNYDIKELSRATVHDQFCMVLQDTWIFDGSIRENLVYNQKNVTDEMIYQATKAVGIDHFIQTLPNGYDTILNETVSLSIGQKQLLTIARAMIKNAPMLILDEATSSVDTRTEELIQKAMDKLMKGRTSFVIAHRLSTIRNADNILVMKDGNIIEIGNHDELIAQKGFYADLYQSQFSEE